MPGGKKILVIEDDAKSRFAMESVLRQHGNEVVSYESAEAAQHLDEGPFDVAIIDVRLPVKSGVEFAAELKHRRPDTTIVFVTAYDDLERGTNIAGAIILVKPINMGMLLKLL